MKRADRLRRTFLRTENSGSGNKNRGSGRDDSRGGLCVDSAVDLNPAGGIVGTEKLMQFRHFRNHIRHEGLPAEPRFNGHHEHHIHILQIGNNRGRRGFRLD